MRKETLIQDPVAGGWWRFGEPRTVFTATRLDDVLPYLHEAEQRVEAERLWAAGYLAYEAGPAFDPAVKAKPSAALPLLWLGLHDAPELVQLPDAASPAPRYAWTASVDRAQYDRSIARIRDLIAQGDTYQVNYTLRLAAPVVEDPLALFARMVSGNDPRYGAFIDCGRFAICSASPELLLRLDGSSLVSRPMKGTAARGLWPAQDEEQARALRQSTKDRAENLMVVDMVRSDLGRVAETGSVEVPRLFELERYPTVWQLTSTVAGRSDAPVSEVLGALFPGASVTGAPRPRTTEIIAELETTPRGVYTGSIGFIAPGRRAQFNVAIRTALVDLERGCVEYGVGGGIVWDSTSEAEYEECLLKARVVTEVRPDFSMLETILWEPGRGYFLLDEHLARLEGSSAHLGVPFDAWAARQRLAELAQSLPQRPCRVRLLVDRSGAISCESVPLPEAQGEPLRLGLAAAPVDSTNRFLYHKTTYRRMYEEAMAGRTDCDDVVLWNERGEATETTVCNLVVETGGRLVTPPIECGLLPGVFRGWLLAQGTVREEVVTLGALRRADRVYVVNSVRKWRAAALV